MNSNLILLRPYRAKYLAQAVHVRETVFYAYQHRGSVPAVFLNAQSDYRTVQLAYLQLIGSYLTAAAQLNLAVGREVIQVISNTTLKTLACIATFFITARMREEV